MVSAAIGVASLVPEVVCHRALRYKRPAPLLPLRLILSTANDQSNRTTPLFQLSTQTFNSPNTHQNEGRLRKLWLLLRQLLLRSWRLLLQRKITSTDSYLLYLYLTPRFVEISYSPIPWHDHQRLDNSPTAFLTRTRLA